MDFAISFAELDVPSFLFRRLDCQFRRFEDVARRLHPARDRSCSPIRLTVGGRAYLDLHPDFPCIEWIDGPRPSSPAREGAGWRIWRPPLDLLPGADRAYLRRHGLADDERSLPMVGRHHPCRGWRDPTGRDVVCVGAAVDEVADRLARAERRPLRPGL